MSDFSVIEGDVTLRRSDGTEIGVAGAPLRVDPTGTTAQPVSATALPLPSGAATEATLAGRAAEHTTAGSPHAARLTDGSAFYKATTPADTQPTSSAAASQADGHSASIGSTSDADTALTVIGRLKQIITRIAGGLPSALSSSGNLKVALQEPAPAGTNRLGAVRLVDHNDVALDLARDVSLPSGSRGVMPVGLDGGGNVRAIDVRVDEIDGTRRLQIEGKVSFSPPAAPPAATAVSITFSGALSISSNQTDNYTITNGKRFVIQQVAAGCEGDSTERGSVVEVFFFDGTTERIVERVYLNGFTTEVFPNTETARDGTACDGNGTTKTIRVRRRRLSGASQEVDFVVRGYEYTP